MRDDQRSAAILDWYDVHARDLPWRIAPADRKKGVLPDPYRVWLSEIMLQQTTVATVKDYYRRFTRIWPDVTLLANAQDEDVMGEWAGLGYYARARNLLKCARVVANDHDGQFPVTYDGLISLPGIGPYTAAAISSIAFDRAETVLDGNIERVMARLFDVQTPLPAAKPELKSHAARLTPQSRSGDYAQAVMDLGATICTPRRPACGLCPWMAGCAARLAGSAETLPRKTPKAPKPTRYGYVYLARHASDGWLLEERPPKGLLGGMLGWPTSDWSDAPAEAPPLDADWIETDLEVRHTFTHFHLILKVRVATVAGPCNPNRGAFRQPDRFRPSDLPTLMRKAFDLASPLLTKD